MRIEATCEFLNRDVNMKTKPTRASIALGRKPLTQCSGNGQDPKVFLMVCTATNRAGMKFKIQRNIVKIFSKFVDKGTCTLRLMEPPKDLMISKSDPVKLKCLLSLLSKVLSAQTDEQLEKIPLTSAALQPASLAQVTKPKEKLVIVNKKEYPITKNFPSSLTWLTINGINLKRFDSRILDLSKLTVLNLNDNSLPTLPESFDSLVSLTELHLANNDLKSIPMAFWLSSSLSKTLGLLMLKNNKLTMIPHQIANLKHLFSIDLSENCLRRLPITFSMLPKLKRLDLINNPELKMLPGAFLNLRLEHFSIGNESLTHDATAVCLKDTAGQVPHLLEACLLYLSKRGLKSQIEALPIIPPPLRDYWNRFQDCICGQLCSVSSNVLTVVKINPKKFSQTFVSNQLNGTPFVRCETIFCSRKCFESYQNQAF